MVALTWGIKCQGICLKFCVVIAKGIAENHSLSNFDFIHMVIFNKHSDKNGNNI